MDGGKWPEKRALPNGVFELDIGKNKYKDFQDYRSFWDDQNTKHWRLTDPSNEGTVPSFKHDKVKNKSLYGDARYGGYQNIRGSSRNGGPQQDPYYFNSNTKPYNLNNNTLPPMKDGVMLINEKFEMD